jgi:RNase H
MGISQWTRVRGMHPRCYVYTDSQAACLAIKKLRCQSGQSIIAHILDQVNEIGPQYELHIIWVPGHAEIKGNEKADEEARKAAQTPTISRHTKYLPQKSCKV